MSELHACSDNRQRCTVCQESIPKDVQRLSFRYKNAWQRNNFIRICAKCLLAFGKEIEIEPIKAWDRALAKKNKKIEKQLEGKRILDRSW